MDSSIKPALTIVIVEDYDVLRNAIIEVLQKEGHEVIGFAMAEDLDAEQLQNPPDLYIIDLNLPGEDGLSLVSRIRESHTDIGIIITSARIDLNDKVTGYENGANVYMPKPLSLPELIALVGGFADRIKHSNKVSKTSGLLHLANLEFQGPASFVRLTGSEVTLLSAFARSPSNTLEHWQVAQHLRGDADISKGNLEVIVGRLRKKIVNAGVELPAIQALRNHGYKLCFKLTVTTIK